MIEHGYEIGNHTWQHTDLTDITTDEFVMTVAEPMIWADEMMGDVPGNQSRILTLPFGTTPDANLHPDQRQMMREGFTYNGQSFQLAAALLVGAEPSVSPASNLWDPMWIPRIQMFDESVEFWFGEFENGGMVLYTSDGHADTVVVPHQLPAALEAQLDPAALIETGKMVIQYDPETGQTEIAGGKARPMATHMHDPWWSRRS
jgi:peptidoglycan/xylan/chitin deacetylase (PgdA/CDA1 family)